MVQKRGRWRTASFLTPPRFFLELAQRRRTGLVLTYMFHSFLFLAWVGAVGDQATTTPINLGGPRRIKALLTTSKLEFVIKVLFLPVDCFDRATNEGLNREKGRDLALWVLARHMAGKESVEFIITCAQVEKTGLEGNFFFLSLRVPREGVRVLGKGKVLPEKLSPGETGVGFGLNFFTRKGDYQHTLDQLFKALVSDLRSREIGSKNQKEGEESFFLAIAEVEERGLTALDRLVGKVKEDILLLTVEKEELVGAIDARKAKLLEQLREAVKKPQALGPRKESSP
jgi:hypothetical protein